MPTQAFAFHAHLHSGHLLEEELRSRLTGLGISPRQARVLDAMDRMGPVSQIELARAFHLTAASMSTMTSRLITAGLIEKARNPDATRGNLLTLSAGGRDALTAVYAAWADMDRLVQGLLGQDKARRLAALTRELRDALGGQPPGPPGDVTTGQAPVNCSARCTQVPRMQGVGGIGRHIFHLRRPELQRPLDVGRGQATGAGGVQIVLVRRDQHHLCRVHIECLCHAQVGRRIGLVGAKHLGRENAVPRQAGPLGHVGEQAQCCRWRGCTA